MMRSYNTGTRVGANVFAQGFASSVSWGDPKRSLGDLIFETVSEALRSAGRTIDTVDTIVLAAHDLIDGRSLSSMVTAPAAGAYLRDEIRLAEDGLAAASLAAAQVESGQSNLAIVAAWGRASEIDVVSQGSAAFDPTFVRPFGLTECSISAMRLSAWLSRHGIDDQNRRRAGEARVRRAAENRRALRNAPVWPIAAHPLRKIERPRMADVVVAMLLGADETPVRLAGIGHGTDLPNLGERDLLALPGLRAATSSALIQAECSLGDISVFELDGFSLIDEVLALEAVGLAEPGAGFAFYADSSSVNQSGAAAAGWCYPAMGLLRLHEAYLRVPTGESGSPRYALAAGASPVGAQSHTAVILEVA